MFRQAGLLVLAGFALTACGGSAADPNIARVCKVLTAVAAADTDPKADPDTVQMHVVMGLANEFEDDLPYLGSLVSKADTATDAACPQARTAIMALTGKDSLGAVMR